VQKVFRCFRPSRCECVSDAAVIYSIPNAIAAEAATQPEYKMNVAAETHLQLHTLIYTYKTFSPIKAVHLRRITMVKLQQIRNHTGDTSPGGSRIGCMGATRTTSNPEGKNLDQLNIIGNIGSEPTVSLFEDDRKVARFSWGISKPHSKNKEKKRDPVG
jgi:hypothetical protein